MRRTLASALALALLHTLAAAPDARAEPVPSRSGDCPVPAAAAEQTVDLNTADEQMLLALPGIGPARARAILAYRAAHGGFRSISQLLHIKGIGRALLKELRPLVTLTEPQQR